METLSKPTPELDLSAFVLAAVDDHLAVLQHLRNRLRAGRSIGPGGRRALALASVAAAGEFVATMNRALGQDDHPHGQAVAET